jgi:hypothetical protein
MTVIISTSYVVADAISGGGTITSNNPILGYNNLASAANIETTTAADGFPAINLANPSTNLRWQGEISSPEEDEYVTIATAASEPMDYIAIARHNLGSAQIAVSVEYFDTDASPYEWVELIAPVMLPNDGPALFRFAPQALSAIRLRLQPGSEAPTIAVVYTGALLVLQRRLYVGHTPINFGRQTKVTNARSESGNFLGRIVTGQMTKTSVNLQNMTASWYRTYLDPFIEAAREKPFFFAWRPGAYPREVGFAWMTNDPMPSNQRANGMMQITMELSGIV